MNISASNSISANITCYHTIANIVFPGVSYKSPDGACAIRRCFLGAIDNNIFEHNVGYVSIHNTE